MTRKEILAIAKPILFNTEMVRAILEGWKTVTRRVIKNKDIINNWDCEADGTPIAYIAQATGDSYPPTQPCPYQPGDILYVRETWTTLPVTPGDHFRPNGVYYYKADGESRPERFRRNGWHPSIHMPKEAARLFLRVTAVRVERVQDITEEGAKEEGAKMMTTPTIQGVGRTYRQGFGALWDGTVKPADLPLYGWNANPWVWVIDFERLKEDGDSV